MRFDLTGRAVTVGLIVLLCCTCALSNVPTDAYDYETTEGGLYHRGEYLLSDTEQVSLPRANATIILKDRIAGTTVYATVGFNFTSDSNGTDIGFVQYPLRVTDGNDTVSVSGLDYAERGVNVFAYAGNVEIMNSSWGFYASYAFDYQLQPPWSNRTMDASYNGPVDSWSISNLTEVGFILQYDNLTLCFANGTRKAIGVRVSTIGLNFTRLDDNWSHTLIVDMSGAAGLAVNGSEVTIYIDGLVPIDSNWLPPPEALMREEQMFIASIPWLIAIVAVVAVVGILGQRRRHHAVPF